MTLHNIGRKYTVPIGSSRPLSQRGPRGSWESADSHALVSCSPAFIYAKTAVLHPIRVWYGYDGAANEPYVWVHDADGILYKGLTPGGVNGDDEHERYRDYEFRAGQETVSQETRDESNGSISASTTFTFAEEDEEDDEEEDEEPAQVCAECERLINPFDYSTFTNVRTGLLYHLRCAIELEADT